MENKVPPPGSDLGPRPGRPTAAPSLSASRTAVLHALRGRADPATLAELAEVTGLHANTVREHVQALVGVGLVRRERSEPHGRGRPAWRYRARQAPSGEGGAEHTGLAAALASFIHRTSPSPREDAIAAGTEWGRDLARGRSGGGARDGDAVRQELVALMEDIGFAPAADTDHRVVRLTRCPLLETAHRYPDVVCGVHLGIVRGALAERGADPSGTDLTPFAEPGACRLDLLAGIPPGHR